MKTPFKSYAVFKEEVQRKDLENKSFFFEEKWVIEAWESASKVNSIYDEPFYKEYLAYFQPLNYLNYSSLSELPDTTTDWDLLLSLLVSSPIIEDYYFEISNPKKLEKYSHIDQTIFWRIPEVTFKFNKLDLHLLSFTDILDYSDIYYLESSENIKKINAAVADFLLEAIYLHGSLFDDTICLSDLPKFDIDFLFKLLIFQLINDSKDSHFDLGLNYPQNKTELLEKYKQKTDDFELIIKKLEIAYKYL